MLILSMDQHRHKQKQSYHLELGSCRLSIDAKQYHSLLEHIHVEYTYIFMESANSNSRMNKRMISLQH